MPKYLQVFADRLLGDIRRKDTDDDVREFHLRGNVGSEIGFTGLDRFLDLGESPASLGHISLDLPCEFDLVYELRRDRS